MKVLLIGSGYMATLHALVLNAMNISYTVIGRGAASAQKFTEQCGVAVAPISVAEAYEKEKYDAAIVAVNIEQLAGVTTSVLQAGCKKILLEKPGGLNSNELNNLATLAAEKNADIMVAYNRRFFSSVLAAEKIIEADGGLLSVHFEFTEWQHQVAAIDRPNLVKQNWVLCNSSHVIDLAFHFAGMPEKWHSYKTGKLDWHEAGAAFSGAGITNKNVLFSYCANWEAPGRWGVELMTKHHRIILKPMEKVFVQKTGSVAIEEYKIDDALDVQFKPGLYLQMEAFLNNSYHNSQITIAQQASMSTNVYDKIVSTPA